VGGGCDGEEWRHQANIIEDGGGEWKEEIKKSKNKKNKEYSKCLNKKQEKN